jgi:hypothetical protein
MIQPRKILLQIQILLPPCLSRTGTHPLYHVVLRLFFLFFLLLPFCCCAFCCACAFSALICCWCLRYRGSTSFSACATLYAKTKTKKTKKKQKQKTKKREEGWVGTHLNKFIIRSALFVLIRLVRASTEPMSRRVASVCAASAISSYMRHTVQPAGARSARTRTGPPTRRS